MVNKMASGELRIQWKRLGKDRVLWEPLWREPVSHGQEPKVCVGRLLGQYENR